MRKLLATILTVAMLAATTATSAFAAGKLTFTPETDVETAGIGDWVGVIVTVVGDPFCAWGTALEYDKNVFEFDSQYIPDGSNLGSITDGVSDGKLTTVFGVKDDMGPTIGSGRNEKDAVYKYQFDFIVKENAPTGDYEFKLSQLYAAKNAAGVELEFVGGTASVHVDGVAAEPTNTIKVLDVLPGEVGDAARENMMTWGLAAVCDVDGAPTAKTITFNVTASDDDNKEGKTKPFTFDLNVDDWSKFENINFVFGLNIKGVPTDKNVKITCDADDVTIQ